MSIHSVITNSIGLIEHYYKNLGINISTIFNAEDDIVFGNIIDFQEIFLNIFSNAKDAIEHDGEIKIITKNSNLKNKEYIFIEIQDTGCGITEENLNKIFEPFFTTKEDGMGLGLAISRSIVEAPSSLLGKASPHSPKSRLLVMTVAVRS